MHCLPSQPPNIVPRNLTAILARGTLYYGQTGLVPPPPPRKSFTNEGESSDKDITAARAGRGEEGCGSTFQKGTKIIK